MNIYLIRHGLTTPGEEGRYQGFLDESLSEKGRAQLTQAPQNPSHVYVSPAKRARETASILFPGAEQICVPGLWEMNFGVFEGRTWKEMENDARYREWVDGMCLGTCPGGESRASFSARVCKAFLHVLDMEKTRQQTAEAHGLSISPAGEKLLEEDLFIVSHGGTQMAILERWGRPARDYYSWQRPCGCGWILSLKEPGKMPADKNEQKNPEPDRKYTEDYCKDKNDRSTNANEHSNNSNDRGKNTSEHGNNTNDRGKNTDEHGNNTNGGAKSADSNEELELQVLEELTLIRKNSSLS